MGANMENIKIDHMVLGSVQTNCFFVYKEDKKEAIVFDPADHGKEILDKLQAKGITPVAICLTHGHFDHILGVAKLKQLAHIEIYANEDEKELLGNESLNCSSHVGRLCTVTPDHLLKDGETFTIAGITLQMIATPGHTVGSCCYYCKDAGILISGDTLFEGSVGRTDLPTGSMSALVRSIKEKLFQLPDDTVVYPGHGDSTTIGDEKKYNPYFA
jgi:glyoxylase-like metal-dependent hydrolase (beta-lactamase superfamily II)